MRSQILIAILAIIIILWNSSVKEGFAPSIGEHLRKHKESLRLFSSGFLNKSKFENIFQQNGSL